MYRRWGCSRSSRRCGLGGRRASVPHTPSATRKLLLVIYSKESTSNDPLRRTLGVFPVAAHRRWASYGVRCTRRPLHSLMLAPPSLCEEERKIRDFKSSSMLFTYGWVAECLPLEAPSVHQVSEERQLTERLADFYP